MKVITGEQFQKEVCESDKPVIVDVYADWCAPCRLMAPTLDRLEHHHEEVKFVKIDADKDMRFLNSLGIQALPTLLRVDKGQITQSIVGYQPRTQLVKQLGLM